MPQQRDAEITHEMREEAFWLLGSKQGGDEREKQICQWLLREIDAHWPTGTDRKRPENRLRDAIQLRLKTLRDG